MSPEERFEIYTSMRETLQKLHSFEPAKIGLGSFGRTENYY